MGLPSRDTVAKFGFVVSLSLLAFFYGFAANTFEWFPKSLMERAWEQYKAVSPFGGDLDFLQPRVFDRTGTRAVQPQRIHEGMTLVATVWEDLDWQPGVKLVDRRGRTIHRWKMDPNRLLADATDGERDDVQREAPHGTHLFRNGHLLVNLARVGTVRLDACGQVLWRLPNGHHSIARADDGTFWVPVRSDEARVGTPRHPEGFPGLDEPVYHEFLVRVAGNGTVLDSINVFDIMYENRLGRHIWKQEMLLDADVTHLNDVEPLSAAMSDEYPLFEAGDLLVSLRNLDLVLVFDPDTDEVKWSKSEPFIKQHDPDYMGEGWIGVFDNNVDGTTRGADLGGSRIISFQPHTDSSTVLFPSPRSDDFYTSVMGKWQRLDNGNLLLTESTAGRVVEVAPDGSTVWEWVANPYDDSRVPEVAEGTRYDLRPADVAEWPCSPGNQRRQKEGSREDW